MSASTTVSETVFRSREIERRVTGQAVSDGAGVKLLRVLTADLQRRLDPFLMLDEFRSDNPGDYLAGFPDHPHRGFETVTYMLAGRMRHRDNAGHEGLLTAGGVQWMTAGRGIVHSERSPESERSKPSRLFGIQAWAALPSSHEEGAPAFSHHARQALPRIEGEGKRVSIILGSLYGAQSPAAFPHPAFYAEVVLAPGAVLPLDADYEERAVFIVSGEIDIAGDSFACGRLLTFRPGDRISILAMSNARLMLLGGEPMDGPRHVWWNFVSSSQDRIRAAKDDWKQRRFPLVPGDEAEFIALPE